MQYYDQPQTLSLVSGLSHGPSSGGTIWTIRDPLRRLNGLALLNPVRGLKRYCEWGEGHITVAQASLLLFYYYTTTILYY